VSTPGSFELSLGEGETLDGKLIPLSDNGATTVLRGGAMLDGKGGRIERGTVVIRGERIVSVSPGDPAPGSLPQDARVHDVSKLTVMPGLMDAHIHFMGNASTDPYRSHLWPSEEVKLIRAAFEFHQTLASGITTVRGLGHGPAEHVYALRQARNEGLIHGPRTLTSGWALSQTRGHGDLREFPYDWVEHERPRSAFCDGPLECRVMARRNFGEGADVIKVYTSDNFTGRPDFTIEELEAVTDEAHRRGKKVATHAKTYEGVKNALLAGVDTIEHGPAELHQDLLDLMLDKSAFLVPTMSTVHLIAIEGQEWGLKQPTIDRARRELEGRQKVVRKASELGIPIVTGSDTGARSNFGILATRELALLVDSGLTPMQAVVAATGIAAKALGLASDVGTLEPGKLADIVVFDGDPLADIKVLQDRTNLRLVFQSRDPLI